MCSSPWSRPPWRSPAWPASPHRWSCWAAGTTRTLCRRRSCTRWRTCRATSAINYSIYGIFYGFDVLSVAYLVLNSTFLPRAIGVLLAIDGLAYLAYGCADL